MAMMPPEHGSSEILPDLERAIEVGYVSFSQLVEADWGRNGHGPAASAYTRLYRDALTTFEHTHGIIHDRFPAPRIKCYAARTSPVKIHAEPRAKPSAAAPHLQRRLTLPPRARQPNFHFVYDLGSVPIGGELLTRIEMMASDATRLLRGRQLGEFLDLLYSMTTDVLGIIVHAAEHQARAAARADQPPAPAAAPTTSGGASNATPGGPAATPTTETPVRPFNAAEPFAVPAASNDQGFFAQLTDRLAIIAHDLDIIELKYLITDARLKHFTGAVMSTAAIGIAVVLGSVVATKVDTLAELGRSFALVVIFGAAGALVSVVQRMSSGSLSVRYDLGTAYTRLLGAFRPLIGAFAGILVWLLVQAKVIANPTASDFFLAAIAFALGLAERSLGDVVTESGILAKLTPAKPSTGGTKPN